MKPKTLREIARLKDQAQEVEEFDQHSAQRITTRYKTLNTGITSYKEYKHLMKVEFV